MNRPVHVELPGQVTIGFLNRSHFIGWLQERLHAAEDVKQTGVQRHPMLHMRYMLLTPSAMRAIAVMMFAT
jgi:hypothetical protein